LQFLAFTLFGSSIKNLRLQKQVKYYFKIADKIKLYN